MTWTRLTVHWIFSNCDIGKVSVYTPSRGFVGLHICGLYISVRGHAASMRLGS